MAEDGSVPLSGKAVFDQELYGGTGDKFTGYDRAIGLDDEELDEREKSLAE